MIEGDRGANPLPSRLPHHHFRHVDPLRIRQRDSQRERFPWSHRQIAREAPTCTREIPHSALSLVQASVVRDRAVYGEVLVETKRKGHRRLARRRIAGGMLRRRNGRAGRSWYLWVAEPAVGYGPGKKASTRGLTLPMNRITLLYRGKPTNSSAVTWRRRASSWDCRRRNFTPNSWPLVHRTRASSTLIGTASCDP